MSTHVYSERAVDAAKRLIKRHKDDSQTERHGEIDVLSLEQDVALLFQKLDELQELQRAAESVEADLCGNSDSRWKGQYLMVEGHRLEHMFKTLDKVRGR